MMMNVKVDNVGALHNGITLALVQSSLVMSPRGVFLKLHHLHQIIKFYSLNIIVFIN